MAIDPPVSAKDKWFLKTRSAVLWSSLLNEPFVAFVMLWLPFILHKDLGANIFQIALLTTLKPMVSLISFYWSSMAGQRKDRLRSNVVISGIFARAPFLLLLFIDNAWYLIFSAAIYMLFSRAGIPAWMEILKLNLPKQPRERLFSLSSALGYAEGVLLGIGIGMTLDFNSHIWKLLFFSSAILGIIAVLIQGRLPVRKKEQEEEVVISNRWLQPWKDTWFLIRSRPDFAKFQWGFMMMGFGMMLVIPVLPFYFVDVLHLSHTDFATARSICMGLGFVFSSPYWGRAMSRFSIAHLTSLLCLGVGLFPLILLFSPFSLIWLYLAYVLYGIVQGGSHTLWHLSGPIFAGHENSSRFSAVNIIMVGIRGMIAPALGGICYAHLGSFPVLASGMLISFCGYLYMRVKKPSPIPSSDL